MHVDIEKLVGRMTIAMEAQRLTNEALLQENAELKKRLGEKPVVPKGSK